MEKKRTCRICGCTDDDCSQCIEKTGVPCHWVEKDLCSACADSESDLTIQLEDCTNVLLAEIGDMRFKRKHIAKTYALAVRSSYPTDWKKVNDAIEARWSPYALNYIQNWAWSGKCFNG